MRIAYILKRYPRYSETFVVNEILAHEKAGFEVTIFALRQPSDTHFQDIISQVRAPVHYIPSHGIKVEVFWKAIYEACSLVPELMSNPSDFNEERARDIYQALEIVRLAKQYGIEHFHAHFATVASSVARIASLMTAIPYSLTAHAKDIFHEDVCSLRLEKLFNDAHKVITVSDFNLDYLTASFPQHSHKFEKIYNGLDLSRFTFQSYKDRKPFILAVGRLVEKKGFDILIDACQKLEAKGIDFYCEIVGAGEKEAELRERISNYKLKHVKLTGPLPQYQIVEKLQKASMFLAPCVVGEDGNRDGLPTVLLEAMALGTPCVSTDVTGIPEIIHDNSSGLLIEQKNVSVLATKIEQLLADENKAKYLAHNARNIIEDKFDIEKNTRILRAIFLNSKNLHLTRKAS